MKLLVHSLVAVLALMPIGSAAQQTSGWQDFGAVLGGGIDRESAYLQGLREGAHREAQLAERGLANAERDLQRQTEFLRRQLRELWRVAGFSEREATSLANAYKPTTTQAAVIERVRRRGSEGALEDLHRAIDNYEFLLANQILLAYVAITTEPEQARIAQPADLPPECGPSTGAFDELKREPPVWCSWWLEMSETKR